MGFVRKSRLSRSKQDHLTEHFVAGTTARTAAVLCGVNRKTAAYFYHRLREIIAAELDAMAGSSEENELERWRNRSVQTKLLGMIGRPLAPVL